jgi:hypothetical protein
LRIPAHSHCWGAKALDIPTVKELVNFVAENIRGYPLILTVGTKALDIPTIKELVNFVAENI